MPDAKSRAAALGALIQSPGTEFLMEAHDGLSARIAEEAGFRGIWASGLAISGHCGVRDNNELSWTQVLDTVEFMADATSIPILLDGDTGYGDFNNVRRLVRKLEQRGGAGVCLEDKLFPKANSLIAAQPQPLADPEEFAGKIKAAKDSQADPDFCVVARVEALIAGFGLPEALRRAEAYRAAGADAILIHSRASHPGEILAFSEEWGGRLPLVIVPTSYYGTSTEVFRRAGIAVVIWANHLMRAAVAAMQQTARRIHEDESLVEVEGRIAPLAEIFRLQGAGELLEAEKRYVRGQSRPSAVILAASRGAGLEPLTARRPKVMLPVGGRPLLQRLVDRFRVEGIQEIRVVAGYRADAIDVQGIEIVRNPEFAHSGELASLACAAPALGGDVLILYGDLLFRGYVLRDLLNAPGEIVAVVDSAPLPEREGNLNDLAWCSAPDDRAVYRQDVELLRVGRERRFRGREADGRWIGMLRARSPGAERIRGALAELRARPDFPRLGVPDLLDHLVEGGASVRVLYIHGHWLDVNNLEDLERAGAFAHGQLD
jgi:phosphoenolpyruvate phosphomutase